MPSPSQATVSSSITIKTMAAPVPKLIRIRHAEIAPGFSVGRALPTREQRMVGAWCFLDHMGPVQLDAQGMHVAAHPHTCLQTFTWMIEGEMLHRDSLGSEQVLKPGEVNLMTAGHGIVHTEDTLPGAQQLHAAQLWIALPKELADTAPRFQHYADLPRWARKGASFTLLAGEFEGRVAPTEVHSPLLGLDIHRPSVQAQAQTATSEATDRSAALPQGHSPQYDAHPDVEELELALNPAFEHGILVLQGEAGINGHTLQDQFWYQAAGASQLRLAMTAGSRLLLLGGEPWERHISLWWNFAGHDKTALSQAQADWEAGSDRFGPVPGETERLKAPPQPW